MTGCTHPSTTHEVHDESSTLHMMLEITHIVTRCGLCGHKINEKRSKV